MTPSDLPPATDSAPPRNVKSIPARRRTLKLPENTVQGCRDRASADLLEAVTVVTANQRRRLERSAESWTVRAAFLDRVNKSFDKRDAIDRAHEQYENDQVRL
ncbi:hypothetical protein LZ016_10545 [Sphingomonas sp. SM33]|uniref:Uncharacterized protein n=1 Tax=Sphingomonas telluris TaxID=2907998 RepID=A0ABS9VNH6_9SPHN|nr:hypothetical protein [Sphingomonas telluris]MCH8616536.1 hypothetical protein [Sphingomonas telluris]